MIKEAIEKILGLAPVFAPIKTEEINGQIYTNNDLKRITEPTVTPLKVHNLSGIVEYITNDFDGKLPVLIHVKSPTDVSVVGGYNRELERNTLIYAQALLPDIPFDKFCGLEQFNILLQSCFVQTDMRASVLAVIGNVKEEKVVGVGDDGVSQQVTAKAGIATVENVKVPNPVYLKPFRTFVEVEQPESAFVLRMKDGPSAALFEADGGAWKIVAIAEIKQYLSSQLSRQIEAKQVVIVG
ncbi:hypothetical protein BBD42_31000 [Paenibacillus sp. BIHB 4019]|uniref:Uncharacterized protein n=1 Tax=Paenibacillus sp. BIHB 4019 TaxID=1870819 RepID=A0A1B2DRT8_9BACL|nr:hypothetical protein [Paenibacillus sp. BIHB 4019]ANY70433.1 hypothetical protein BBD42_31000 [Paenibacillus sp. BIHB 4019]